MSFGLLVLFVCSLGCLTDAHDGPIASYESSPSPYHTASEFLEEPETPPPLNYLGYETQVISPAYSNAADEYVPSDISSDDASTISSSSTDRYFDAKYIKAENVYYSFCGGTAGLKNFLVKIYITMKEMLDETSYNLPARISDAWNTVDQGRIAVDVCRELAFDSIMKWDMDLIEDNAHEIVEQATEMYRNCYLAYHVAERHCDYLRAALSSKDPKRYFRGFQKWFREVLGDEIINHL
jgi:hypothetical protein